MVVFLSDRDGLVHIPVVIWYKSSMYAVLKKICKCKNQANGIAERQLHLLVGAVVVNAKTIFPIAPPLFSLSGSGISGR